MARVAFALVPGIAIAVWAFGYRMIFIVIAGTIAALLTEIACARSLKVIKDGSALITGLLVALCMPPTVPLWIVAIASLVAIGIGKHAFGGLGNNLFNPAMVGYVAVLVSYPEKMTQYDAITGATALEVIAHEGNFSLVELTGHTALGLVGATGHEWVNAAFLLGGCYLCFARVISWHMPASVLLGAGLAAALLYDGNSVINWESPLFHWFAGATMLTAFFIATDPVTSPSRSVQVWIYGLGVGVVALLIRRFGSWPDGFAFSILLANVCLPLIEKRYSAQRGVQA